MKTKIMLMALGALVALGNSVFAFSGTGSGTENNPYVITDVYQLQEMSNELDAYYVLGNDIDASGTVSWNGGEGFEPVGVFNEEDDTSRFTGTFDGQGYTITGLFINRPSGSCIGLFGILSSGSEIMNVVLSDVDITGYEKTGSVFGACPDGTVSNCQSSGQVTCIYWHGGGFAGAIGISGTVTDCSSSCSVSGYRYTGGFCGRIYGTTTKCHASGEVFGSSGYVGGFAGMGTSGSMSMSQCYATGNVTSTTSNAGGFIGGTIGSDYVIDECYATGDVVSNSGQAGGFIGGNTTGVITNCYATGSARGTAHIGGFVGINHGPLQYCYSTGGVTSSSSDSRIGGLCGTNDSTIADCYYDTETSGRSDTGKGTPKTTTQMMQQTTFEGWDFYEVWTIDEGESYPYWIGGIKKITGRILSAIEEKKHAIETVEGAIERETKASNALDELLESGDYGELRKGDIVKAMRKILSAIDREEQSLRQLEQSIEKLYDALESLGWEPPTVHEPDALVAEEGQFSYKADNGFRLDFCGGCR